MNVGYDNLNTADVATILGVTNSTVAKWCRDGHIKYTDVGSGGIRPRYMFDEDEVERVRKEMEKHGKKTWMFYVSKPAPVKQPKSETAIIMETNDPDDYIPNDTDELTDYIKKIRALKVQRDKLLAELDAIDESIKTMRDKVIEAI